VVSADGAELGDVAQVLRDGSGKVERLLLEIEDSNPDRYVYIPVAGLKTVIRGPDTDLSTTMTKQQLMALAGGEATGPVTAQASPISSPVADRFLSGERSHSVSTVSPDSMMATS